MDLGDKIHRAVITASTSQKLCRPVTPESQVFVEKITVTNWGASFEDLVGFLASCLACGVSFTNR